MIVYRCDLCGEVADCAQKRILCERCWSELETRLKGKGRPVERRETVLLPPPAPRTREETPEKPLPGGVPTIFGRRPS